MKAPPSSVVNSSVSSATPLLTQPKNAGDGELQINVWRKKKASDGRFCKLMSHDTVSDNAEYPVSLYWLWLHPSNIRGQSPLGIIVSNNFDASTIQAARLAPKSYPGGYCNKSPNSLHCDA